MNLTVTTIAKSLTDYLAPRFPSMTFCKDPNQQGSISPYMFLQTRYNYTTLETSGLWRRRLGSDLTYLEDYNLPGLQQRYQRTGETLDLLMETFPYSDEETTGTILLRAHERGWCVGLNALHYHFELLERVSVPEEYVRVQTIDYDEEVKNRTPRNSSARFF